MASRREVHAAVRDALLRGAPKGEVRRRLVTEYEPEHVDHALEAHPDPVAREDERLLQRLLVGLFAAALATKLVLLFDVSHLAAASGNVAVERVSLGLAAAWTGLFFVLLLLLLRASANGYTGVLGWSVASLGYSGVSLATAPGATNLQLTLFVFDVAFALCCAVLAMYLWRALYRPHAVG